MLEKNYPNLVLKAKKFLGFEVFFELSSQPYGMPLDASNVYFKTLIQKHKEITKSIEKELMSHQQSRDANPQLPEHTNSGNDLEGSGEPTASEEKPLKKD